MDEKPKYPRVIAHAHCAEGDPNAPPRRMTLDAIAAEMERDQQRMLDEIEAQIRAHYEREQGVTIQ